MRRSEVITVALGVALVVLTLRDLLPVWKEDPTLSHAPLLLIVSLVTIWRRRALLSNTNPAVKGLVLLVVSVVVSLFGHWADVPFLSAIALPGMFAGTLWSLAGWRTLRHFLAPLGLLLFTVPWPTALTVRLQFWLQMTSSAYAALGAGLLGVPVVRDGVTLHVVPNPALPPVYSILVAQKCSGLSSLMALLALGYLVGWFTPLRIRVRILFLAAVFPLTLVCNALRLTFILKAGSGGNIALAHFVHDNEQPVLMLLCGAGLMGLRWLLLRGIGESGVAGENLTQRDEETKRQRVGASLALPNQFASLNAQHPTPNTLSPVNFCLAVALFGAMFARQIEARTAPYPDFFAQFAPTYRDWQGENMPFSRAELAMLEPDSVLAKRYVSPFEPKAQWAELSVIAGHRKKTVHNPAFCIGGDGWETISEESVTYEIGEKTKSKRIEATRARIMKDGVTLYATYFFTDGEFSCASMGRFQVAQIVGRLKSRPPLGALVRILVPAGATPAAGTSLSDDFCYTVLPGVLQSLEAARLASPR